MRDGGSVSARRVFSGAPGIVPGSPPDGLRGGDGPVRGERPRTPRAPPGAAAGAAPLPPKARPTPRPRAGTGQEPGAGRCWPFVRKAFLAGGYKINSWSARGGTGMCGWNGEIPKASRALAGTVRACRMLGGTAGSFNLRISLLPSGICCPVLCPISPGCCSHHLSGLCAAHSLFLSRAKKAASLFSSCPAAGHSRVH